MYYVKASARLTGEQIVEAASIHAGGISLTHLGDRYNMSAEGLRNLLTRRGFPITSVQDTNARNNALRKYPCNEQFFSSFCDEQRAYWSGFIAADGCIMNCKNSPNSRVLQIAIANVDRSHLEKFKACLQAGNPIRHALRTGTIKGHAIRSDGIVKLVICSKTLCDDLSNNGIGPRKTTHEQIPKAIPDEHKHHFIRGYLDGDGWWSLGHKPGWEAVGFCGGRGILSQIKQWVTDNIPEAGRPAIIKVPGMYRIQWQGGRQTRAIIMAFYKDCTIALDRKVAVATSILRRHDKSCRIELVRR